MGTHLKSTGSCWDDCAASPCLPSYPRPASFMYRKSKMWKFGRGAHQLRSFHQAEWGFPNSPRAAHNPPERSMCGFKSHSSIQKIKSNNNNEVLLMKVNNVFRGGEVLFHCYVFFAVITCDWEMTLRRGTVWARGLDVFIFQFFTCP